MADQMPLDIVYRVRCTVYRFWYTVSGKRFTSTREFLLLTKGFLDAVFTKLPEPQGDSVSNRLNWNTLGDGDQIHRGGIAPAAHTGLRDARLNFRQPLG